MSSTVLLGSGLPVIICPSFFSRNPAWCQTEYHSELYIEPIYMRMVSFFYSHRTVTSGFTPEYVKVKAIYCHFKDIKTLFKVCGVIHSILNPHATNYKVIQPSFVYEKWTK